MPSHDRGFESLLAQPALRNFVLRARHVGWIGENDIELPACQEIQHIPAYDSDWQATDHGVEPSRYRGTPRDVHGGDVSRAGARRRYRQRASTGTQIQNMRPIGNRRVTKSLS